VKLRKLNDEGLNEFSFFINSLRQGVSVNIPTYMLGDDRTSESIDLDLDVEVQDFNTRYDMGLYLISLFGDEKIQALIGDRGLWSWLALLWFDQLCPKNASGQRKPSMEYNYVLSEKYNHRPRHAIYMTWQLVNRYGEDSRFMLCKGMATRGEITEQMMARQDFLSSKGVMGLASSLYFDNDAGGFKKGAAARKSAGCITRYIAWLQQLQVNYDLYSITKDELKELLPKEFDRFLGKSLLQKILN
jgi:hypothetical protein